MKPDYEVRVKAGDLKLYYWDNVTEINENEVSFTHESQTLKIDNDFVFAMTGYKPNLRLLKQLDINADSETGEPTYNDQTMETNANRIYLTGVICSGLNTV
jgi:thioredoxin reductase